jgi:DNA-binding MarR family transcriptional regulator
MAEIEENGGISPRAGWSLHPLRSSILQTLRSASKPLSFKELTLRTGIGPSLCAYHLKVMDGQGMVVRSFSHEEGRKDYSYYAMTGKGEDALIIEKMFSQEKGASPMPSSIALVAWRNMPRCFIIRRV